MLYYLNNEIVSRCCDPQFQMTKNCLNVHNLCLFCPILISPQQILVFERQIYMLETAIEWISTWTSCIRHLLFFFSGLT